MVPHISGVCSTIVVRTSWVCESAVRNTDCEGLCTCVSVVRSTDLLPPPLIGGRDLKINFY